jgi:putative flippase GtrA
MADLRQESRRLLTFLLAGTIAFGVDLGVYHLAVALLGSPALAKGVGWAVAVATTFSINSLLTFRTAPAGSSGRTPILQGLDWRQFPGYTATQALGGVVNIGLFLLLHPHLAPFPSLALATAAAAGCNYLGARAVLGRKSGPPRP